MCTRIPTKNKKKHVHKKEQIIIIARELMT